MKLRRLFRSKPTDLHEQNLSELETEWRKAQPKLPGIGVIGARHRVLTRTRPENLRLALDAVSAKDMRTIASPGYVFHGERPLVLEDGDAWIDKDMITWVVVDGMATQIHMTK